MIGHGKGYRAPPKPASVCRIKEAFAAEREAQKAVWAQTKAGTNTQAEASNDVASPRHMLTPPDACKLCLDLVNFPVITQCSLGPSGRLVCRQPSFGGGGRWEISRGAALHSRTWGWRRHKLRANFESARRPNSPQIWWSSAQCWAKALQVVRIRHDRRRLPEIGRSIHKRMQAPRVAQKKRACSCVVRFEATQEAKIWPSAVYDRWFVVRCSSENPPHARREKRSAVMCWVRASTRPKRSANAPELANSAPNW